MPNTPQNPTLTLTLSLSGDLIAQLPSGLSVKLDSEACYYQLYEILLRQKGHTRVGESDSPTQWDLDEPARKARIWAQFNNRPVGEYFALKTAVLAPGDEARVVKYTPKGKPKVDLEGLLNGLDVDKIMEEI